MINWCAIRLAPIFLISFGAIWVAFLFGLWRGRLSAQRRLRKMLHRASSRFADEL